MGHVTSGTLSPTLDKAIGLALVSPGVEDRFEVVIRDRPVEAHTVPTAVLQAREEVEREGDLSVPEELQYTKSHEWVRTEGDTATIGITDHAQDELGDVVFVELPEVGAALDAGDSFGTVESVKAVSDLYTPVGGEVVEVNESPGGKPREDQRRPLRGGLDREAPRLG